MHSAPAKIGPNQFRSGVRPLSRLLPRRSIGSTAQTYYPAFTVVKAEHRTASREVTSSFLISSTHGAHNAAASCDVNASDIDASRGDFAGIAHSFSAE